MNNANGNISHIALCGVLTALSVVLMLLTGLIPVGTYALPAAAGLLSVIVVIESGPSWAWPMYTASAILSVFLAADKEAAMLYIVFFGYYPILKSFLERFPRKAVSWILKFLVFNAAMVVGFVVSIKILGVPQESFTVFGIYLPWVFLVAGNLVFPIYDYAISGLIVIYYRRFHRIMAKWMKLR